MIPLNQLLNRFKNLTNSEKVKKQLVVEILTNKKIPITIDQISISKTTVFTKVPPIIKTELLFQKEEILKEIQKISGLTTISNIQ
ncbi:MAG: hypothetical protein M0P64_01230 [Candidatus Pacebacteria bacterium]|jgi:hypothetical protein|nr:hypothetical protein [Candidatus Paceibacterota bacterium]